MKNKNISNLYAVIMAGGKGTRFWPFSREAFPKQFLRLVGDGTLLQETITRLSDEVKSSNIIIVTTKKQRDLVGWQLREMDIAVDFVIEPEGKNTAPAIALAAFKLFKKDKNALMLILPADHYIGDTDSFRAAVRAAVPVAEAGYLVTFGIRPDKPETGYGYIKTGAKINPGTKGKKAGSSTYKAEKFVEKPDRKRAEAYLKEGSYYWNSGMFLFRAKTVLAEMKRYMPEMYESFEKVAGLINTDKEADAVRNLYKSLMEESIDYGVMEKSKNIAVVTADFRWSDIGHWGALDEVMDKDGNRNILKGNVVEIGCRDSIFFTGERLIAAIGLDKMVIVDTKDATLICPKDEVQRVKELVGRLKAEGKEEYLTPRLEERPWGFFSILEKGAHYQIKLINVNPRSKLSLQMHNHRSEHWIVVSGVAGVQRGEEVFLVKQNESTFIPANIKHRLENPGTIPLKIIEIQSGEYLGEDDIIRFGDTYGRNNL